MKLLEQELPAIVEAPCEVEAELLRKAAYRVGQPGAWCQHYLGRTRDGRGTHVRAALATYEVQSRCLLGAVYTEYDMCPSANIHATYDAIVKSVGTPLLADWNDHPRRTQDEVVGALLKAAEIVGAR